MAKKITSILKSEIIEGIAKEHNVSKAEAERMYNTVFGVIVEELKSKSKKIKNSDEVVSVRTPLGVVKVVVTKARKGVNPQNPSQRIDIPAGKKVKLNKNLEEL